MKDKLLNLWDKLPKPARIALPALLAVVLLWKLFQLIFPQDPVWIGYVEGEYLYVTSPVAGYLRELDVRRGQTVEKDTPLFQLEGDPEEQARDQAEARLQQAKADLRLAEQNYERATILVESGAFSRQQLDERSRDLQSSREAMSSAEQSLSEAQWRLSRKTQNAQQAGLIHDTYYVEGDWVEAGKPVLSLLPPGQIKARFYIPQNVVSRIRVGQKILLQADGLDEKVPGTINYISDRTEYTPPVIYSTESRDKLVFLIEAGFAPEDASKLHPGQPVSITPDNSPDS